MVQETWTDQAGPRKQRSRTLSYDQTGHITLETVASIKGTKFRLDTVDYLRKTWQTQIRVIPPSASSVGLTDDQYFPDELRTMVRLHRIGPVGHRRIDGIEAVLLQGQLGPYVMQVWVRPVSYLALRARAVPVGTTASSAGSDVTLFSWTKADTKTLSKLDLVIPHGFVREH